MSEPARLHHTFKAMGSPCELVLEGSSLSLLEQASERAVAEIARIEQKYSRYRPESLLSRINAQAGLAPVPLDDETASLLRFADQIYRASEGLFDITSGVLRMAWAPGLAALPSEQDLAPLLGLIGWERVRWSDTEVFLPEIGMQLDFGGFGKEYAVDRATDLLAHMGVAHGYVNLAGDMRCLGPRTNGEAWRIGIQHPRDSNAMLAVLELSGGALATSGDYERAIWVDGEPYGHVLHPKTGNSVRGWQSVTVMAPLAVLAGAAATTAMLLESKGLSFLHQTGLGFLARDHAGASHTSSH